MDLDTIPLSNRPPPGETININVPNTELPPQIALSVSCTILCVLSVSIRIYTRRFIIKEFKLEDWALILAAAGSAAFAAVEIVSCKLGKGKHAWNVSVANYLRIYALVNIEAILYCVVMFCAKYAVLQLIKAIFYDHRRQKMVVRVIWGLIWTNLLMYSIITLLIVFGCKPLKKQWHPEVEGQCLNQADLYIASGVINIISDLTILAVPLAAISKLQAPLKTKIASGSLFSIGAFACMASIARFFYSFSLDATDPSWLLLAVNQWALGEVTTVIVVACLPFFPRFIKDIKSKINPSSQAPNSNPTYVLERRGMIKPRRSSRLMGLTVDTRSSTTDEMCRVLSESSKDSQSQSSTRYDAAAMV